MSHTFLPYDILICFHVGSSCHYISHSYHRILSLTAFVSYIFQFHNLSDGFGSSVIYKIERGIKYIDVSYTYITYKTCEDYTIPASSGTGRIINYCMNTPST